MKYVVSDEIHELSAYQAKVTFEKPVSHYTVNEDFELIVQDLLNQNNLEIDNTTFSGYGLTKMNGEIERWEEDSFISNGGLLMYFIDSCTMYIKILARCKDENDEPIGFNTSNFYFIFNRENQETASVNCPVWPFIKRSKEFIKYDSSQEDPVFSADGMRVTYSAETDTADGYDFEYFTSSAGDRWKKDDYDSKEPLLTIDKNFDTRSTDTLYLSTVSCPVYTNDVSAFYTPENPPFIFNVDTTTGSLLIDDTRGLSAAIPYVVSEEKELGMTIPVVKDGDSCDYTFNTKYLVYTQIISAAGNANYKNRLYLGLDLATDDE